MKLMMLALLDTIEKTSPATVNKTTLKKGQTIAQYKGKLIHLK